MMVAVPDPGRLPRAPAPRPESRRWCRHWPGALGPTCVCRAGVDLVALCGPRRVPGWLDRVPCGGGPGAAECALRSIPSGDEVRDRQATLALHAGYVAVVCMEIAEGGYGPGSSGTVPCPSCRRGAVSWSRHPRNGHLRAHCGQCDFGFME